MNLGKIYDITKNNIVGVICCDYEKGDLAYCANDSDLLKCLDVITNNPLYFLSSTTANGNVMITREKVDILDSHYILAVNYNLPPQWRILDVKSIKGDIESITNDEFSKLNQVGDDKDE